MTVLGVAGAWDAVVQAIVTVGAVAVAALPFVVAVRRSERRRESSLLELHQKADATYAHINGLEEASAAGPGMTLGQLVQQLDRRVQQGFASSDRQLAAVLDTVSEQQSALADHEARLERHAESIQAHRLAIEAHSTALGALSAARSSPPARPGSPQAPAAAG